MDFPFYIWSCYTTLCTLHLSTRLSLPPFLFVFLSTMRSWMFRRVDTFSTSCSFCLYLGIRRDQKREQISAVVTPRAALLPGVPQGRRTPGPAHLRASVPEGRHNPGPVQLSASVPQSRRSPGPAHLRVSVPEGRRTSGPAQLGASVPPGAGIPEGQCTRRPASHKASVPQGRRTLGPVHSRAGVPPWPAYPGVRVPCTFSTTSPTALFPRSTKTSREMASDAASPTEGSYLFLYMLILLM